MNGKPFKKILGVLKDIAPTAVAALAGPYAPLAAGVMRKVMGNENSSDAELEDAILAAAGDPEAVVKLREIEAAMTAQEQQLGIEFERLAVEDRKDARLLARETTLWPQITLSSLFVVGYFIVLGLFFSDTLQAPASEAFVLMLGVLTGGVPQVMSFWLGSSSGSAKKTDMMKREQ